MDTVNAGSMDMARPLERSVARARVALSAAALLSLAADPSPALTKLFHGAATPLPAVLWVLLGHFVYCLLVILAFEKRWVPMQVAAATTWIDALFATAIAAASDGPGSPVFGFFAFTVLSVGFRSGLRRTALVTTLSSALYLTILFWANPSRGWDLNLMRPVNLAILGYLVGYLGDRRLSLEKQVRELGLSAERTQIARSLHDGSVQALAGVNLRLETCRELLRRGRSADVLDELGDLQTGITREYDELRSYIRTLTELEDGRRSEPQFVDPRVTIRAELSGSGAYVDHVLQVMREAITNVQRHARASSMTIAVEPVGSELRVTVDDDGIGFPQGAQEPWSIASRVRELNGSLQVHRSSSAGARLEIILPSPSL